MHSKPIKSFISLLFSFLLFSCIIIKDPHAGLKSKIIDPEFSQIEKEIFEFQNLARTNPKAVAKIIEEILPYYEGTILKLPGEGRIRLKEGKSAALEAIEFLKDVKPIPPLIASKGMSLGAKQHVINDGQKGRTGHYGFDGSSPFDRISRYGKWLSTAGENLAYGQSRARDIIIGLIIDDGVSSRGHRTNIFNKNFKVTGIAYGSHTGYGSMTCITYSGGYIDR